MPRPDPVDYPDRVITGIACALPDELEYLRSELVHASTIENAGFRFDAGRLDDHEVVLAQSGMGKVNAAIVATTLIERFGAGALVLSGVAGGLDPDLRVGDIVIAERAIHHDAGLIVDGRSEIYQAGHVPFLNPTERLGYEIAPALAERVRSALGGIAPAPLSAAAGGSGNERRLVMGTVLTGDQYVSCEETRVRLHATLGGLAVEMEGAVVAQVAEAHGLPWLLVRSLSDLAGRDAHFDFQAFGREVAVGSAMVLHQLLPVLNPD